MASAASGSAVEITVGDTAVRITSPNRPLWKDGDAVITKLDLARYYDAVSEPLLRALRDRPTTLQRWPHGVLVDGEFGESFYNKHLPKGAPAYVDSVEITFPSGRTGIQVCPTNAATILWAANLGCVTFHPWPVTDRDVDRPDEMRLDLDPQPGRDFADAVEAALALRDALRTLGADPYVKTSGGRGLHIFIAIEPRWEFLDVRHAAIALGRALERDMPDLVTTAWWKEERGRRVFLDYNQMARDRTMASAWSVRSRPGAPVSMPVTWEALRNIDPAAFTLRTVPGLYAASGDPWESLGDEAFDITPLLDLWQADVDERGLGEMPFPPDYPKMPGEPPRVQPSRRKTDS
ncbi:MAG: ATP-dependent DNA ligase [Actinomycetales bacterium mxb001]|nr:MAG: ATP-dependent DNA ligase [Actinomycetales bacterium mxb001]